MGTLAGLVILGVAVGVASAFFGIGGGIISIPALVFLFGYSQKMATGTTLAMLLPPIGVLAFIEYYRAGFADIRAACLLVAGYLAGSYFAARFALSLDDATLKKVFGVFLIAIGAYFILHKK